MSLGTHQQASDAPRLRPRQKAVRSEGENEGRDKRGCEREARDFVVLPRLQAQVQERERQRGWRHIAQ